MFFSDFFPLMSLRIPRLFRTNLKWRPLQQHFFTRNFNREVKQIPTILDRVEMKWQQTFHPLRQPKQMSTFKEEEVKTKPIVGYWYIFSGALVFGIVVLGGITRLTESGLSIVEWNVIKGMKPPSSVEEWNEEFEKYKQFPEYKLLNHNISMEEFKRIFYFEWAHRMWGRAIGLAFVLPGLWFASRGYMTSSIKKRSFIVACMIGTQGLFGWLMVKSGLDEDILKNKEVPRVNHFWLSTHLGSAFLIYCTMLATGMEILTLNKIAFPDPLLKLPTTRRFKKYSIGLAGLVFLTAISGAWVAGLDAGLIYNEFPFMGEGFVPSDMWFLSTKSEQNSNPITWYENLARNPSAVQFNHRVLVSVR
jgi:heme a synthase